MGRFYDVSAAFDEMALNCVTNEMLMILITVGAIIFLCHQFLITVTVILS